MSISELKRRLAEFERTKQVLDEALEDDELTEELGRTSRLLDAYIKFLTEVRGIDPEAAIKALQAGYESAADVGEEGHVGAINDAWAVVTHLLNLSRER